MNTGFGRFTPKGTQPHSTKRDRNRRRRWLDKIALTKISNGCKAWLLLIAKHSDDSGKGVWGRQTKQAELLRCSERSIRNYRKEAEQAGLIKTCSTPYDPVLGKRPKTNYYILCIPSAKRRGKNKASYISTGKSFPVEQQPTVVCKTLGSNKENISVYRMPEMELDYPDRPDSEFAKSQIALLRSQFV